MNADFDHIAQQYDHDFTNSAVGKYQRQQVWDYLNKHLTPSLKILEINCGTGYDANYLAKKKHHVQACDISPKMIEVAKNHYPNLANLNFLVCDTNKVTEQFGNKKFDLVFSNFGGLNCLKPEELQQFFEGIPKILRPNARLILVIMGKYCLWESLYFFVKFKWGKMFRRATNKSVAANVEGKMVDTWYYHPKQIKQIATDFKLKALKPIGFAVPPSYLDNFFKKRPKTLSSFNQWDKCFTKLSALANLSDHYLIDLEIRA